MFPPNIINSLDAANLDFQLSSSPPSYTFLNDKLETGLARYSLTVDFIAFRGHFDGLPVLPALAQVLAAKHAAQKKEGRSLKLKAITQAKFLSLVEPDTVLAVYFQAPENRDADWRFHLSACRDGRETDASFLRLNFG